MCPEDNIKVFLKNDAKAIHPGNGSHFENFELTTSLQIGGPP